MSEGNSDSPKRLSNKEIADIVELEGLDYAIMYYLTPEDIEDEDFRHIWTIAREALFDINDILKEYGE